MINKRNDYEHSMLNTIYSTVITDIYKLENVCESSLFHAIYGLPVGTRKRRHISNVDTLTAAMFDIPLNACIY